MFIFQALPRDFPEKPYKTCGSLGDFQKIPEISNFATSSGEKIFRTLIFQSFFLVVPLLLIQLGLLTDKFMTTQDIKSASIEYCDNKWKVGRDKKLYVIFLDPVSKKHMQRLLGTIQSCKYKGKHFAAQVAVLVIWAVKDNVETSYILKESKFDYSPKPNYGYIPFEAEKVDGLMSTRNKGKWLRDLLGLSEPSDDSNSPNNVNNQSVTSISTPSSDHDGTNMFSSIPSSLDVEDMGFVTPSKNSSSSSSSSASSSNPQPPNSGADSFQLPKHLQGVPAPSSHKSKNSSSPGIHTTSHIHNSITHYIF